jgi:hypothetical protein
LIPFPSLAGKLKIKRKFTNMTIMYKDMLNDTLGGKFEMKRRQQCDVYLKIFGKEEFS